MPFLKSTSSFTSVYQFSSQLIETGDLDPVYIMLWNAKLEKEVMCRWLVAYWCFYHVGTACWITSQKDFWKALLAAASTKEHPRSSERRHFRGQAAIDSVKALQVRDMNCDELIASLGKRSERPRFPVVAERVKEWRGFGDWIAFKVADMLERLDLCLVQFQPQDVFDMFESPRKGAEAMAQKHGPAVGEPLMWAYTKLQKHLQHWYAPPRYERHVNIQEIETCLCKWKSHLNGHYEVGKDIDEVHHGLERYNNLELTRHMLKANEGDLW